MAFAPTAPAFTSKSRRGNRFPAQSLNSWRRIGGENQNARGLLERTGETGVYFFWTSILSERKVEANATKTRTERSIADFVCHYFYFGWSLDIYRFSFRYLDS